jgi:intracellular multiplication protein IcmV
MAYSRTKSFFSKLFHFKAWSDFSRFKKAYESIFAAIRLMFVAPFKQASLASDPSLPNNEKFNEMMKKYQLDDEKLNIMQNSLLRWVYSMLAGAFLTTLYLIYHIYQFNLHSALLTLMGIGIFLVLAFRYHYFYFQIITRRLGCSLSTWFKEGLLGIFK